MPAAWARTGSHEAVTRATVMSPDTRRELWQRCDAQPGSAERSRQPTRRGHGAPPQPERFPGTQAAGRTPGESPRPAAAPGCECHRFASTRPGRRNRPRPPTHCGLRHGPRRPETIPVRPKVRSVPARTAATRRSATAWTPTETSRWPTDPPTSRSTFREPAPRPNGRNVLGRATRG